MNFSWNEKEILEKLIFPQLNYSKKLGPLTWPWNISHENLKNQNSVSVTNFLLAIISIQNKVDCNWESGK